MRKVCSLCASWANEQWRAQEGTSSPREKQEFGSQAEPQVWFCRLPRATPAQLWLGREVFYLQAGFCLADPITWVKMFSGSHILEGQGAFKT